MTRRIFHGWYVVAAAFVVTCVGFGNAYTFSAFVPSLQRDFAASRGSVSLVFSLAGFLYFALGLVSGPLADRFGSRPLCAAGMALIGAGICAAGWAHTLTAVYLCYGLGVGLGIGTAYVPAVGAVQRWFVRRRGFASGLAVSGIGVGTLIFPPLAAHLIAAVGWRHAYLILGATAGIAGVAASLFVENDPGARGLGPDGDPPGPAGAAFSGGESTVGEVVRSRRFVLLYAACLVSSFGMFVPFVHLVPYALDHGIGATAAALLLAAVGVGSTGGRFFLGGIADKLGRGPALVMMFGGMAATLVVWAVSTRYWELAAFALTYGVFYGGFVAVLPALTMDYFGGRRVSGILGVLYTSIAFGTLIAPTAAGYAYDWSGSYTLPILAGAAGDVIAALMMWRLSSGAVPVVARGRVDV
jgi:MFS family permease